jgi:hypothetical protein
VAATAIGAITTRTTGATATKAYNFPPADDDDDFMPSPPPPICPPSPEFIDGTIITYSPSPPPYPLLEWTFV